jgi:hypothetical protein
MMQVQPLVLAESHKLVGRRKLMSFDLAVWHPQKRVGDEEARELYLRLCDGDTSGVVAHPAVDAFYAELIAKHPEIDKIPEEKIDNHELCPWSCKLDHSPGHVILCCVWSKATYVSQFVESLARKHGLAMFDPQTDRVTYPDSSTGKTGMSRGVAWTLGLFALLFAAMFVYSTDCGFSRAGGDLHVGWALRAYGCGLLSSSAEKAPPQVLIA